MSYPYAPRIGPVIGGGLPGIPQRSGVIESDPAGPPVSVRVITPAALLVEETRVEITPSWARFARVTALGRGGFASRTAERSNGGGGAGLAASAIEPIPPETGIEIRFTNSATLVNFLNYLLSGGNGGNAGASTGGGGGVGSGGAINFNGGAGAATDGTGTGNGGAPGGGAAGRGGNGEPGTGNAAGNSGPGDEYATGGGAGGAPKDVGGIRYGAITRAEACLPGAAIIGKSTAPDGRAGTPDNCNGGLGGGGAGGVAANASNSPNSPGAALVLIELW